MIMTPARLLRSILSLSIALLSPGLTASEAAARIIAAPVTVPAAASASGMAGAAVQYSHGVTPNGLPVMSLNLNLTPSHGLTPSLSVITNHAVPALAAESAAAVVSPMGVQSLMPHAQKTHRAGAQAVPGVFGLLQKALPVKPSVKADSVSLGRRLDRLFDGMGQTRKADTAIPAVTGRFLSHASGLGSAAAEVTRKKDIPAPSPAQPASKRGWKTAAAVLAAALILAVPATALAAGVPTAVGVSLAYLSTIQPFVTAGAAAAGALYGLLSTPRTKGESVNAAQILASVLRFGLLAGAGVYVLMDITQVLFLGIQTVGIATLPAAMATAALGQGAFQGKFKNTETSSADRLMAVFPAAAAALGFSVGIQFAGPALLSLAVSAMAATGVASALFAALYQPGKSPEDGPATFARGYVLQALMSGLALTMTNPYLAYPFAVLAAWGFWDVISTVVREAGAHLPPSLLRKLRGKGK